MAEEEPASLPNFLPLIKMGAARIREIQSMKTESNTSTAVKLAFQKLPRHMRRRAMTHNAKRLPRRLREIHRNQQKKSGLPPPQKRPSRKYRRRPYNLISEYIRRQSKVRWLNTHIWHAKRFHMVEKWGYKLPFSPCDRAFRACYRATTKHCLLQDVSYTNCLEITGEHDNIVECLRKITNSDLGLSISAKAYSSGLREGNTYIFRPDTKKAIGAVKFHWKPNSGIFRETRSLWLWCHVAFYKDIIDNFVNFFGFTPWNDNTNLEKFSNGTLRLIVLKQDLCRFKLTGPLSTAILHSAFKLASNEGNNPRWAKTYLSKISRENNVSPHKYWEKLSSCSPPPSELTPHLILPLLILDPRLNLPSKRTKALQLDGFFVPCDSIPPIFLESPIWQEDMREVVNLSKLSNAEIAKHREKLLVSDSDSEMCPTPIPVLLIQQPGKSSKDNKGYGCGWDIILPSSWAQPIWLSLIMRGAKSGGLRESDSILFEAGQQNILSPDTSAGEKEEKAISEKMKALFFKIPPNKRTNYSKFKITSPFNWNWKLLIKEWSTDGNMLDSFFVLRDKKTLTQLGNMLSPKIKNIDLPLQLSEHCLIPVQILLSSKGICRKFSVICIPEFEDLTVAPTEPFSTDPNEPERKLLRKEHKTLLKQLMRKRKKLKQLGKDAVPKDTNIKEYVNKMRSLWLPEPTNIRHSCSREVIGFVKHGDFSFLYAKSKAIGYITLNSLKKLFVLPHKNKVLVRSTNSRQYYLGTISIITE